MISVEHNGVTITYNEDSDTWHFGDRCATSLAYARAMIDFSPRPALLWRNNVMIPVTVVFIFADTREAKITYGNSRELVRLSDLYADTALNLDGGLQAGRAYSKYCEVIASLQPFTRGKQ